ncbi:neuropeptide-like 1 isoform X1 [Diachasmimorpha longicaudata]|uniref:neuropeptide-like 1 isoform X1 n=1 Tax=Diachasmimorpha longicaudata TaxID=58733 RepID=UPI0030B8A0CF
MANCKGRYCLLLIVLGLVGNQLRIPVVTCQEDDVSTRCLPRKTFYAFLRLPEVSSNLAAYSRTARIMQDARNDFAHLKSLSASGREDSDDTRICLPAMVYYDIFSDPTMQAHLNAIERVQKMIEEPEREDDSGFFDSEKRSLATLAKNGDLPASIQERVQERQEDGEKRSESSMTPEELLKLYVGDSSGEKSTDMGYPLPRSSLDAEPEDRFNGKRNIASLARDYALPGRRNIASMAREFGLPSGKRNVGSLARDRQLPSGKRSPPYTLGRIFVIPVSGKRNLGSLARDSALPPYGKRGIASLAKNGDFPFPKRNVGTLARDWSLPQSRHGRSLDEKEVKDTVANRRIGDDEGSNGSSPFEAQLNDVKARGKRQADYTDEYPLPVMQNTNVLDYEDIIEAIANGFPQATKRFMGAGTSLDDWQDDDDTVPVAYHGLYQPSKRHIGALARLGWLPSFRAARFSRSPRYLVGREDSADGTTSDNTSDSATRSLSSQRRGSGTRYEQSPKGDCRHGFRRYLLIPTNDNYIDKKLRYSIDF